MKKLILFGALLTNAMWIGKGPEQLQTTYNSIAIGDSSDAFGTNVIAIGSNSVAIGVSTIAIGNGASNTLHYHIVIKFDDGSIWESDLPHKPLWTKEHPIITWK